VDSARRGHRGVKTGKPRTGLGCLSPKDGPGEGDVIGRSGPKTPRPLKKKAACAKRCVSSRIRAWRRLYGSCAARGLQPSGNAGRVWALGQSLRSFAPPAMASRPSRTRITLFQQEHASCQPLPIKARLSVQKGRRDPPAVRSARTTSGGTPAVSELCRLASLLKERTWTAPAGGSSRAIPEFENLFRPASGSRRKPASPAEALRPATSRRGISPRPCAFSRS
jgi:hypothetical protein